MKTYTTEKQLNLRLLRTLTNKYAETAEPRFRKAFKKACNESKEFASVIDQLTKAMDSIFISTVQKIQVDALKGKNE